MGVFDVLKSIADGLFHIKCRAIECYILCYRVEEVLRSTPTSMQKPRPIPKSPRNHLFAIYYQNYHHGASNVPHVETLTQVYSKGLLPPVIVVDHRTSSRRRDISSSADSTKHGFESVPYFN